MIYVYGSWKFTVTPIRIYAENEMQRVYLYPKAHYWRKHLNFVRALIEMGEIHDYETLVHYCRGKVDILPAARQPAVPARYQESLESV